MWRRLKRLVWFAQSSFYFSVRFQSRVPVATQQVTASALTTFAGAE
jgi:hypothetical protein